MTQPPACLRWILCKLLHPPCTHLLRQESMQFSTICMWAHSTTYGKFQRSLANNYRLWTLNGTSFIFFPLELSKIRGAWALTTCKSSKRVFSFICQMAKKAQLFKSFGLIAAPIVRVPPSWLCTYIPRDPTMTNLPKLDGESIFKAVLFQRSAG